jgi:hypothetical protein
MATRLKPPAKKTPSLSALARSSGIARESLRTWQAQGIDIFDPEQLLARIEAKKGRASGKLGELKEEKLRLECQRLRTIIQREAEMLTPTEDVLAMGQLVGTTARLIFREMAGAVVGQLEGRTGPEMFKVLRREVDDRLTRISEMPYMPDSAMVKRLEEKISDYEKRHSITH